MLDVVSTTYLPTKCLVVEIILWPFLEDVRWDWLFLRADAARVSLDV